MGDSLDLTTDSCLPWSLDSLHRSIFPKSLGLQNTPRLVQSHSEEARTWPTIHLLARRNRNAKTSLQASSRASKPYIYADENVFQRQRHRFAKCQRKSVDITLEQAHKIRIPHFSRNPKAEIRPPVYVVAPSHHHLPTKANLQSLFNLQYFSSISNLSPLLQFPQQTSKMPPPPPPTPQTGSCLCGLITYTITPNAPPVYSVLCHCDNCKKATGGHFICNTIYQKQHFTLTHGSPKAYRDAATDSGTPLYRHFCGDCGSNLWITTPLVEGIVSVLTGTLDAGVAREAWRPNKGMCVLSFVRDRGVRMGGWGSGLGRRRGSRSGSLADVVHRTVHRGKGALAAGL